MTTDTNARAVEEAAEAFFQQERFKAGRFCAVCSSFYPGNRTQDVYQREIFKAGYLAAAEAERPRWIPVEERLPERSTYVLAYSPTSKWLIGYCGQMTGTWFFAGDEDPGDITHWMPIPALPAEPQEKGES